MRNSECGRDARRAVRQCLAAWVVFLGLSFMGPRAAQAGPWGCQVLLCLSNPSGPEQYAECVPPIERLWAALRHGDPFPTCDAGTGGASPVSVTHTFASAGYCREDLLYWGGPEQSELLCNARGAINVVIDGALTTRVWWGVRGDNRTITEFYGAGGARASYDPAQSVRRFLARGGTEASESESGGGGE